MEDEVLKKKIDDYNQRVMDELFGSRLARCNEAQAIAYIEGCALDKLVPLLDAMIDVVSDELGCATELEDARDVLRESIGQHHEEHIVKGEV